MTFELTEERHKYLDARGNTILLACPGSGKTTCIVKKLKDIANECEQEYGKGIGVLCLSFTNKACEEIKQRYSEMHGEELKYPHEVCTIDSFVTRYILMPYWYLYKKLQKRPSIINEKEINRSIFYIRNDSGKEIISKDFNDYLEYVYKYKPEDLSLSEQGYKLGINVLVSNKYRVDLLDYSRKIWNHKISKGVLSSTDALQIGKTLLAKQRNIAVTLAHRFPYVIVDEAQDTSGWQFEIFQRMREAGTKQMEFIGDLNQSIYEWREAKPSTLQEYEQSKEWNVLHLTNNRRSVQRIINLYSRLKPRGTPSIVSYNVKDKGVLIDIVRYNPGCEKNALHLFESKCAQNNLCTKLILVRGKAERERLSAFKREVYLWKKSIPYGIIKAQICFNNSEIKDALNHLKWAVAKTIFGEYSFDAQKSYIEMNENCADFNVLLLSILSELLPLSASFRDWGNSTVKILKEKLMLDDTPNFLLKRSLKGFVMKKLVEQPISDYFGRNDNQTVNAQTIHFAKGASVDAVLFFINVKTKGKGISLKQIPSQPDSLDEMDERHRLIYVACSRAKQYLALAVPSTISKNELRERFNGLEFNIISL